MSDSNLIGGNIKLPSEMLYHPLPVVFVDIRFGGSPAPFRQTLQNNVVENCVNMSIRPASFEGTLYRTVEEYHSKVSLLDKSNL